jgi:hypothetical protein
MTSRPMARRAARREEPVLVDLAKLLRPFVGASCAGTAATGFTHFNETTLNGMILLKDLSRSVCRQLRTPFL